MKTKCTICGLFIMSTFLLMCTSKEDDSVSGDSYEGDDEGECNDGADNNRDGLFDCNDPGCAGAKNCKESENGSDTIGDTDTSSDSSDGIGDISTESDSSPEDDFNTDNICEKIELNVGPIPNRVVIVQDLSRSLDIYDRWDPLKEAMVQVVDTYEDEIALGVVPFPTRIFTQDDDDCAVDPSLVIAPEVGNGEDIYNLVYAIESGDLIGGTPTYDALLLGQEILANEEINDNAGRYMILVTDGAPTCLDGEGYNGGPADVARVSETVESIHNSDDINLYIVGYGMEEQELEAINTWASLGGTEEAYLADDADSLIDAMSSITVGLISCSYTQDEPIRDPLYVRVQVDGVTLPYDSPDGWALSEDKMTVIFQGESCEALRDGENHNIDVAIECKYVVV